MTYLPGDNGRASRNPFFQFRSFAVLTLLGLLACASLRADDEPAKKTLLIPKSPTAAAYMLGRLTNKELIEAPRGEFVYVALLQRSGLERKYRLEALDGLAKVRNTDRKAHV